MPTFYEESFSQVPLADIVPAYVYTQYNDDPYVTAFFTAFNGLAQGYLDWFNQTPLPIWTNSNISGSLLDFIANDLYGISRPVISTLTTKKKGAYNTFVFNTLATNGFIVSRSGTAVVASDDYYKRTMTWFLYKGDGIQMTITWLKKRIARFLYGVNGQDFDLSLLSQIGIDSLNTRLVGAYNTYAFNTSATNGMRRAIKHTLIITIPALPGNTSTIFQYFIESGILPLPFQLSYKVVIG